MARHVHPVWTYRPFRLTVAPVALVTIREASGVVAQAGDLGVVCSRVTRRPIGCTCCELARCVRSTRLALRGVRGLGLGIAIDASDAYSASTGYRP
jgi:hypothetical protein